MNVVLGVTCLVAVTVLVGVTGTSEQQVDTENHDVYESRVNIQVRYGACKRGLGGKCVKKGKRCPKRYPLETKPGRPHCNKRRRCCYPEPITTVITTELPIAPQPPPACGEEFALGAALSHVSPTSESCALALEAANKLDVTDDIKTIFYGDYRRGTIAYDVVEHAGGNGPETACKISYAVITWDCKFNVDQDEYTECQYPDGRLCTGTLANTNGHLFGGPVCN